MCSAYGTLKTTFYNLNESYDKKYINNIIQTCLIGRNTRQSSQNHFVRDYTRTRIVNHDSGQIETCKNPVIFLANRQHGPNILFDKISFEFSFNKALPQHFICLTVFKLPEPLTSRSQFWLEYGTSKTQLNIKVNLNL